MSEAIAGLVGALIGALAALGAQLLTVRHASKADRRRELVDLVSRVWESSDRLWRASEGLDVAVFSLGNAERGGYPGSGEVAKIYEQRRQQSMADQHAAEVEARFTVAQMRLLYPSIAGKALALVEASASFDMQRRDELRTARQEALEAYETAARKLLDTAD